MKDPARRRIRLYLRVSLFISLCAVLLVGGHATAAGTATTIAPYTIGVFAASPVGLSKPDSITFNATNIFVGYGNGGAPDGSGGAMSNIVEYDLTGKTVVRTFAIVGHNDGLKINPRTGDLWALQNEDGNATLVIIDLESGEQTTLFLGTGPHGGGYDDVVFDNRSVFLSASAPANSPNTAAAIVSADVSERNVELTGILNGDAPATDVTTGESTTLNLQDPDSMIVNQVGELVMTSQSDGELIVVRHPKLSCQQAFVVPLTSAAGGTTIGNTQADDTIFASTSQGRLLVADKNAGVVYEIAAPYFEPGAFFSAISVFSSPSATSPKEAFVGQTNLATGFVTPIVIGMSAPGGMAFVPAVQTREPESGRSTPDRCP